MHIYHAAMLIALEAHGDARNKHDNELYILHLARVYINVCEASALHVELAIAWLHDILEDTDMTIDELRSALLTYCPEEYNLIQGIVAAVDCLTKKKGESNETYYHRVKMNPHARFVKLNGDLVDNFRRNHNIQDETTRLRMAKKYSLGMDILT